MQPTNENNFLIEVTPEQFDALRAIYLHVDDEGYEELHYSPYWKDMKVANKIEFTGVNKVDILEYGS